MKLLKGSDDFPMYKLPGQFVSTEHVATIAIRTACEGKLSDLASVSEYYRLMAKSVVPFIDNEQSCNQLIKAWCLPFAGLIFNGTDAHQLYDSMATIMVDRLNYPERSYVAVPTYHVDIETRFQHTVTGIKQDGYLIMATVEGGWVPDAIYYSHDISTSVIGCNESQVEQFIKIANHLNSCDEEHEND